MIAAQATPVLLFRGLDGGRKALRLAIVDRIEEVPTQLNPRGGGSASGPGRRCDPSAWWSEGTDLDQEKVRVFRLNDGQHEIGYAFAEVLDFASIDNDIIHADRPGEVSGVSLINGEPAELIDAHWLFAQYVGAAARKLEQLVCLVPGWDPWMQNMLRPLVEAAGYRVIDDADDDKADVVIACIGEELPNSVNDKTIWLRPEPEAANKKDDSIYRYDRAGLLVALKSASVGRGK